ncbi:hypothetical protein SAMN05444008_102364 [Cnuella takakiae]|uniref:Prophage tail endopeptidase domain-containing protein n=1 Tax=Cnuella takakiae TaxID=1302690 RepID=A0A1M4VSE1_9BACT|nr:hypothetical protein [Cnuella takakiae]OLY92514.1 hypothetical protein BUE76_11900 [Cnuella takakiae]SHE71848.1 hypothetical protein SAMN05444008_102364 [Cnuella takakiae]
MDKIEVKRGADLFTVIKPEESSTVNQALMQPGAISLQFRLSYLAQFQISDWCEVFGVRYTLHTLPQIKKRGTNLYEYTMQMQDSAYDLSRVQFLFLGSVNTLTETDFTLRGTAQDFLQLLVGNMNRVFTGWQAGACPATIHVNLSFAKETVWNALARVAEAFGTEFWVDGGIINLGKLERRTGHTYRQGMNQGLRELSRINASEGGLITRLYAYGSEKNLPAAYRNFSSRLRMFGADDYIEQNTAAFGIREGVVVFEDIYPNRTGTVTGVNALNPFEFSDTTMDFDLNTQLPPGLTAKVTFNTGQLQGYTFDLSTYNHTTRRFTFLKNKQEGKMDVPSTLLRPQVGDQYVLVDILMPATYVEAAEKKLLEAARQTLDASASPLVKLSALSDPKFLKHRDRVLLVGDVVFVEDTDLSISRLIRITALTRNIVNEWDYDLTLSDATGMVTAGRIEQIVQAAQATGREVTDLGRTLANNATLNGFAFLPTTPGGAGFAEVLVETATGKLYRKQ